MRRSTEADKEVEGEEVDGDVYGIDEVRQEERGSWVADRADNCIIGVKTEDFSTPIWTAILCYVRFEKVQSRLSQASRTTWSAGKQTALTNAAAHEEDQRVDRERREEDEERRQLERRLEEEGREAFLRWEEGESEREVVERENERCWEKCYTEYLQSPF